jgi:uncharacterized damage-inducible protein DinB
LVADVTPFARLFALNTDLLLNATDDVADDEAVRRVLPHANSIAFLVAHLTDMRHYLAAVAGHPTVNPLTPLLERAKSEDDVASWPPLETLRGYWTAAGGHLAAALPALGDEQLAARLARPLPGGDPSLLGGIAFAVQHESYHLGQIAMLRRGLGRPAMSYRRRS